MKQMTFGDAGLQVSALCLGCMFFGTTVDEATSFRLLDAYYDAGGRFLDTANNYAFWVDGAEGGESEALVGRWLSRRGRRDEMFLATKVGANPTAPGGGFETAEGLSASAVRAAIEASLRRLETDRVDLYYAHVDDRATPLEETVAVFGELVDQGLAGRIGCSNTMTWRMEQARGMARRLGVEGYCCVQQRHSYLRPKPGSDFGVQVAAGEELLDYCASERIALLAYSALLAGALTRERRPVPDAYAGADAETRLGVLHSVADEVGASPNQVALAWLNASTPPVIPLVAASSEAQLSENLGALDIHLDAEHMRRLDSAGA
jgi:aryl-alcohol dehydrogenase-like predicted oxidoreductase